MGNFVYDYLKQIQEDVACIKGRDPAARSVIEVLLLYPGLKAVLAHRHAHWFYDHDMRFLARVSASTSSEGSSSSLILS